MYFFAKWHSKPYNEKIEKMIAEGRTELPLKKIYDDFEWDYPCVVYSYRKISRDLSYCILNETNTKEWFSRQNEAQQAVSAYALSPANFRIAHDEILLVLVNEHLKTAKILVTDPKMRGKIVLSGSKKETVFQVSKYSYGTFLELIEEK